MRHLVCIDSETLEIRRYEQAETSKGPHLSRTHEAGFIPNGDRAKELEVIERFRKFPSDVLLHDARPRFDPIEGVDPTLAAALASRPDPYIG